MASRMVLAVVAALLFAVPAGAQDLPPAQQLPPRAAPTAHVEVHQLPMMDTTPKFDAERATDAYLARVGSTARASADAYTEGNHILRGVDLAYTLVVAGLLLWLRISARIRDWAEERTRNRIYQTMIYAAAYVVLVAAAEFPLLVYEKFFRAHAYGLSNQDFSQWLGDFAIRFAVILIASLVILPILYGAARAAREIWWLWGAGIAIAFFLVYLVIYPVFIAPLFNHYSPLPDSPLKQEILSLARANGVPAGDVWLMNSSHRSDRIRADVSGFLGTTRIALNDNLLTQASHDEVLALLGRDMGQYVLGRPTRLLLQFALVAVIGFAFLNWGFRFAAGLFGGDWQVRRVEDVAGLPLLVALGSIFLFFAMPVTNTILRTTAQQADMFGVNAVRKPDAFATVALKLSAHRRLDPGKWEELVFYDQPSGRSRIHAMMVWKKEHIRDADIRDTVPAQ